MSAKDTVVGTAKQIVAEIVGDGRLAEESSRQAGGNDFHSTSDANADFIPPQIRSTQTVLHNDEDRFARLLGHAALKVWSDLPRDAQERLFAAAVDDGVIANSLAVFLHDRHPKTAHPRKPSMLPRHRSYRALHSVPARAKTATLCTTMAERSFSATVKIRTKTIKAILPNPNLRTGRTVRPVPDKRRRIRPAVESPP